MRASLLVLVALGATSAFVACGSADQHPLGGPYGGSSNGVPAPSRGDTSTTGSAGTSSGTTSTGGATTGGGGAGPIDSGAPSPAIDSGPAPTWTAIFDSYLKAGTEGNCSDSGCHKEMSSPPAAYEWLDQQGYPGPTFANPKRSPLTWYGGNMPPDGGASNAQATTDIAAWAAAGAQNN